jgi:hypothetical protein
MTVTANTTRNDYLAGNNQNVYNYTFQLNDAADVTVILNGVIQTLNVHYTVQDLGVGTGGTITFTLVDSNNDPIFPTQGQQINILMTMELDRDTAYQPNGAFLSSDVNNDYDRLWLAANQQQTAINRSLRLQDQDATSGSMELPLKASRLNRMLAFDSVTGEPIAGPDITSVTEGLTLSATLINGNNTNGNDVIFNDNDKAKFGTGSDLEIYHDGNNSVIKDSGTGILKYTSNNSTLAGVVFEIENTDSTNLSGSFIHFKDSYGVTPAKIGSYANAFYILNSSDERMLTTTNSGAIELYYANDEKLATTSTGVDVTGEITVSGDVDGRDIATDGVKLDSIEVSADVTDTESVTAAGALMESEVTNLSEVKAFSSADYATAAQGANADAALPKTGGTLTGDLNFGDNVKAKFGGGGDLEIYHNGNNSIIKDSGDGILRYTSSNSTNQGVVLEVENTDSTNLSGSFIHFKDSLGITPAKIGALANEMYLMRGSNNDRILVTNNSSVELYHADDKKFETSSSGASISGDIAVTGTVDGRDVATDGTKLDGIDAYADVTDATNVAAAGALMDSEVTNLAQVKAFDSSDYATSTQGTTADNALPKSGGTLTGNLNLGDNIKAQFGASNDLQIYHDSTNSIIKDSGTGILRYTSSNATQAGVVFEIENTDSTNLSGSFIHFKDSLGITPAKVGAYANELYIMRGSNDNRIITTNTDAVELYYADDEKLTTTSSGIDVTGTVKFDGLEGTNSVNITQVLDEDSMTSDSATSLSTQQSIKSYVDTAIAGVPQGDITGVTAGTNLSGGGTTGSVNLDLENNISLQNITLTGYLRGPSNFTIDPAAHGDDTGTLVVAGNLQVDGTTTTINSTTVEIADLNFKVAKDATSNAEANTGGFTVGGSNAELKYLSSGDKWTMNKTLSFADSLKTTYGNNDDLQIYHDGSNSIIKDSGTGILRYTSSNSSTAGVVFEIENTDSANLSGSFIHFKDSLGITPAKIGAFANELYIMRGSNNDRILTTNSGAAELYYSDDEKLATTSTGIDVTGTATMDGLTIASTSPVLRITNTANAAWSAGDDIGRLSFYSTDASAVGPHETAFILNESDFGSGVTQLSGALSFGTAAYNAAATERMRIDSSGNVGIGNSAPLGKLTISNAAGTNAPSTVTAANTYLQLGSDDYGPSNNGKFMIGFGYTDATNTNSPAYMGYEEASTSGDTYGDLTFYTRSVNTDTAPTERMRIDSSGNLLVGQSSTTIPGVGNTTAGVSIRGWDGSFFSRALGSGDTNNVVSVNRSTADGNILGFQKDGTTVGSIGTVSGDIRIGGLDDNHASIRFAASSKAVLPVKNSDGGLSDNTTDLGASNARFKDLHLSGGVNLTNSTTTAFTQVGSNMFQLGTNSGDPTVFYTSGAERMRIDSSGNVGIGTSLPFTGIDLRGTSASAGNTIQIVGNSVSTLLLGQDADGGVIRGQGGNNALKFYTGGTSDSAANASGTERMRIDSSGNLLVGKTATAFSEAGVVLRGDSAEGLIQATRANNECIEVNRIGTDGAIAIFAKDGLPVGTIGNAGAHMCIGTGDVGWFFAANIDAILPTQADSTQRDGAIDLGASSHRLKDLYLSGGISIGDAKTVGHRDISLKYDLVYMTAGVISPADDDGSDNDNSVDLGKSAARFNDIYATNSTIQTSDRNEKQDIEELSDAEQRVAVACKSLLRKFRWKSAVQDKGDDARIHFGIVAQDLQDAFEAEGLDAGRYAMFISTTWTDEDGEEQTRMGVRYSELLAFIISAI